MLHFTAHSIPGDLLFVTWIEARALWDRLLTLGPPYAMVLMPDHVHLLAHHVDEAAWERVLRGYRAWRYQHRLLHGPPPAAGPILLPRVPAERVPDRQHLQRTVRYIHLNPCRGQLVSDPLAWPFSTHRDRVGLAIPLACPPDPDPCRFHHWVSADPSVAVDGTRLPEPILDVSRTATAQVLTAVSALFRLGLPQVLEKGPARRLAVGALRAFGGSSARAVARSLGIAASSVTRLNDPDSDEVALVARLLGDARFYALDPGDLSRTVAWRRYQQVARNKRLRRAESATAMPTARSC